MFLSARPRREAISSRLRPGSQCRLRSERGSVAVSMLLIPLAFLAVFSTIQIALIMHGRNVVAAAAEDALYAASQFGANNGDGEDAANNILALADQLLEIDDVHVDKGKQIVVVTITGRVAAPLGMFNDFEIGAEGPVEKFYLESERSS